MKTPFMLLSLVLVCGLSACGKPKTDAATTNAAGNTTTATTSQAPAATSQAQVSSDPLVAEAQKIVNSDLSYNGYACLTLNTASATLDNKGFMKGTPVYFKNNKSNAAKRWAFLAQHGAATVKDVKATDEYGNPAEAYLYTPNLTLKETDGKGFFHSTESDNQGTMKANTHFCYGKWTVTKVLDPDVKVASTDPAKKKIAVEVTLTDAPAWAKTKEADFLNQPTNAQPDPFYTYDDMNQPVAASLSTPARVIVDVPK